MSNAGVRGTLGADGWEVPDIDGLEVHSAAHAAMGIPFDRKTPALLLGGDHSDDAYAAGFHRIPLDRGLPWYLAINTGPGDTSVYDGSGQSQSSRLLTWTQLQQVQAAGVELVSHGSGPHLQSWDRINTGLLIRYTGDGTAATVAVAGTYPAITIAGTVTGSSDGSASFGPLDTQSADYDTLGEVATYINGLPGWDCELDYALTGDETANTLLMQTSLDLIPTVTISCAGNVATVTATRHGATVGRTITISGATPSQVNGTYEIQATATESALTYTFGGAAFTGSATGTISAKFDRPVCAGGGIVLRYTGTTYKKIHAVVTSTVLRLLGDGVLLTSFTLANASYDTIAELVTGINAAGITGLLADRMDARRAGTNATAGVQTFLHGDELSANLAPVNQVEVTGVGAVLQCGLSRRYMIERRIASSVEAAAAQSITIKHFAESGSEFYPHLANAANNVVGECRGNPRYMSVVPYPYPMAMLPQKWHPVVELNKTGASSQNYDSAARLSALVDALADSTGFCLDTLVHAVTADGSSGYTLPDSVNTEDLTETQFVGFCDAVRTAKLAGNILTPTVDDFYKWARSAERPENFLFNPRFKNSGESLLGLTPTTGGGGGYMVPGIGITTPAHVTAAEIDTDGRFVITTNAATSFQFLLWEAVIEPGKLYELGAFLEILQYTSGNITMTVYGQSYWSDILGGYNYSKESDAFTRTCDMSMYLSLPPQGEQAAQVISKNSGPFNVPTGTSKIKMDGIDYVAGINLAGSTPSATTAKEVAANINAAFSASALYSDEYKNVAKAVGSKVVITSPYAVRGPSAGITIATDTGSEQLTAIFGNTYITGIPSHGNVSGAESKVLRVIFTVALNGKFAISRPFLREIPQAA